MTKRKGRQRDTEFEQYPLEQVLAIYRDPTEPAERRQRALRHLKAIGVRNVQKRGRRRVS